MPSRFPIRSCPPILILVATCALIGCKRPDDGAANTPPPTATDPNPATADTTPPPPTDDGVSMRYLCDGGHAVALVRGELARVTLADGRVVEIPRIADSAPPAYRGEALSFEVGSDGGTLGQDEVGGFDCRADE
ncbi:hypothetical protein [Lysobacter sp. CFH 32150]|uniref:hypothetical protein n=1 Tax=Lysobacter sp. CFH 32150 TaxID=2927128 RepID=UPI001FA70D9B|nr:hypothetical protein [Lysobacter sp. CFH 32150]MCI4568692.1 hypothetical protein [Lysobacter sp. CFH 32150]